MIIIIVVFAAVLGVVFFYSTNAKKSSEIKITSNKTLSAGDSLSVKLTGLNNTAISNETVKITIKDSNGNVMCSLSITAKFAYDGTTAQCVSYSPKTTVNATYWTAQNLSSINKLSYVSASATFVFSPPFGSELSKDVSLTISCTPDGTVY